MSVVTGLSTNALFFPQESVGLWGLQFWSEKTAGGGGVPWDKDLLLVLVPISGICPFFLACKEGRWEIQFSGLGLGKQAVWVFWLT